MAKAINSSRQALMKPRQERYRMVERYAGAHWGPEGRLCKDDPVNLLALYVNIMARALVAKNPRAMLSTFDPDATASVSAMQDWLNAEIERQDVANVLQRSVIDALFCVGIVKVGLATPADAAVRSWNLKAGFPFAEIVDIDDFAFNVHARDFSHSSFFAHRIRVPLDSVKDSKLYTKARKKLEPTPDKNFNEAGDERVSVLGRGWIVDNSEEHEDMVDLWEVYLPRHRCLLTLADDYISGAVDSPDDEEGLRRTDWIGPDSGPYHILGYGTVPGSAMPKAPIQDLYTLHNAHNRAVRKAVRSIDDLKELTLIQGIADSDGKRVVDSSSGDMLRVDNPESMKQVVMGGQVIQSAVGMAQFIDLLFNKLGGNLEVLGGRSSQGKTLGQEELLNQNAFAGVADLAEATIKHTSRVLRSLCWFYWNHPTAIHTAKYSPAGLPDVVSLRHIHPWNEEADDHQQLVKSGAYMRKGPMPQLDVDPYSLTHDTPQSRAAMLEQFMAQVYIPLAPWLGQQGIMADMHAYLKKIAFYRNMPDLPEILSIGQPPPSPDGSGSTGGQDQPRMPGSTSRTYNRKSTSEKTAEGQKESMVNSMLSGKSVGGSPNGNGKLVGMA